MHEKYKHIGEVEDRVIEECAELIKAITKAKRFGITNTHPVTGVPNYIDIRNEIEDVKCCLIPLERLLDYVVNDRERGITL